MRDLDESVDLDVSMASVSTVKESTQGVTHVDQVNTHNQEVYPPKVSYTQKGGNTFVEEKVCS